MTAFLDSPYFGIVLSIAAYSAGIAVNKKLKTPLANPLLIAVVIVIAVLKTSGATLAQFNAGGDYLTFMLVPATAALAVSVYRQRELIKERFLPILIGCAAGSAASMGSVYGLCRLFRVDEILTNSLIPKSVTTPIAMELSVSLGGVPSVTVAAVILTGMIGAVFAPLMIKMFRVDDPVAAGIGIGASSHALGTSSAIKIGSTQGAMSGIAIGICGIMTVFFGIAARAF